MTSQRKLGMVETWSTVEKRAKRTLDITVKTTQMTAINLEGSM